MHQTKALELIWDPVPLIFAGRAHDFRCFSISTLRNGRYYDCAVTALGAAVDSCRRTYEENPDLIYDSDEGSYLTKIFGAFSLRPTVMSQTPIIHSNVLGVNIGTPGYGGPSVPKVHTVPFITVRIPPQVNGLYNNQPLVPIDLQTIVSSSPNPLVPYLASNNIL